MLFHLHHRRAQCIKPQITPLEFMRCLRSALLCGDTKQTIARLWHFKSELLRMKIVNSLIAGHKLCSKMWKRKKTEWIHCCFITHADTQPSRPLMRLGWSQHSTLLVAAIPWTITIIYIYDYCAETTETRNMHWKIRQSERERGRRGNNSILDRIKRIAFTQIVLAHKAQRHRIESFE